MARLSIKALRNREKKQQKRMMNSPKKETGIVSPYPIMTTAMLQMLVDTSDIWLSGVPFQHKDSQACYHKQHCAQKQDNSQGNAFKKYLVMNFLE